MEKQELPLQSYRALDLTDEKGFLCGRILGDLGAEVIKIEPPDGDPCRRIGPYYHDIPDPEKSLYWFAYNANKSGITLDIENTEGQNKFKELVKKSDFVIESFPPGYMSKIGLDYKALCDINPKIILTSISPFGQNGPWKDYKGADIVLWALSSYMYVNGDPDRPPVQISFPQSYLQAGAEAALGTLFAHYYRGVCGEGQWVDVSIQQTLAPTSLQNQQFWNLCKMNPIRAGAYAHRPGHENRSGAIYRQRRVWPCKDGHVLFLMMGGSVGVTSNKALTEWMDREGLAPEIMKFKNWGELDLEAPEGAEIEFISQAVEKFFKLHTKEELFQWALKNDIMLCPISNTKDLAESPQLESSNFWIEVEHPELEINIKYPGAFGEGSETHCTISHRAPLIGEHTEEVFRKLGISNLGVTNEEGF